MLDAQTIQMILFLFLIGATAAYFARLKGRNLYAWFILGFLFGLLALIVLFFLPSLKNEETSSSVVLPVEEVAKVELLEWYYLDELSQQHGPVALQTIHELFEKGILNLTSYLWREGMADWERIEDLEEIRDAFKSTNLPS